MNWILNSMTREAHRDTLADGLKAFVRLYYDEYTDATEVEPGALRALDAMLGYLSIDLEGIVSEVEEEINDEGGVRSDSDGTYHKVCTYKREDDA